MNPIARAIEIIGGPVETARRVAAATDKPISYQAVDKWAKSGRLPRTDWTGETRYAEILSEATGGEVPVSELRPAPQPRLQ